MPVSWTLADERRLLLGIIKTTNAKPPSWPGVAEKMGDGFTAESCRQHFQKIKRESGDAPSTPIGPTASRKRKASESVDLNGSSPIKPQPTDEMVAKKPKPKARKGKVSKPSKTFDDEEPENAGFDELNGEESFVEPVSAE